MIVSESGAKKDGATKDRAMSISTEGGVDAELEAGEDGEVGGNKGGAESKRRTSLVSSSEFKQGLGAMIQKVKDEELFPPSLVRTQIQLSDGRVITDPGEVAHVLQGGAPAATGEPVAPDEQDFHKNKFWEDMTEDEQGELTGKSSHCDGGNGVIDPGL